jgi:hypothetical protein
MSRKEGVPKCFGWVTKGSTQFPSLLKDEEVFLVTEEITMRFLKLALRCKMEEDMTKLSVVSFALVIIQPVHRSRSEFRGAMGGSFNMWIVARSCLPNSQRG